MSVKILLVGAGGQVGQAVVRFAFALPIELFAVTRGQLDITDQAAIVAMLAKHRPSVVINAAAYTAVDKAESEPDLAQLINAQGPEHLAKACHAAAIPLIHLSTDYVFDGAKQSAYLESDSVNPQSVYGASKWAGEQAVRRYCKQHYILRVSWVFGIDGANFVKTILRLACERSELSIVADQYGCPTSAASIADVLVRMAYLAIESTGYGTYHFSNGPVTTWYEFAQTIVEQARLLTSLKVESIQPITTLDYPTPAKRPANSELNSTLVCKLTGIPLTPWREELRLVLKALL